MVTIIISSGDHILVIYDMVIIFQCKLSCEVYASLCRVLVAYLAHLYPQTTGLIVKAQNSHIRALLHNNKLFIKIIIIILTIYNMV